MVVRAPRRYDENISLRPAIVLSVDRRNSLTTKGMVNGGAQVPMRRGFLSWPKQLNLARKSGNSGAAVERIHILQPYSVKWVACIFVERRKSGLSFFPWISKGRRCKLHLQPVGTS